MGPTQEHDELLLLPLRFVEGAYIYPSIKLRFVGAAEPQRGESENIPFSVSSLEQAWRSVVEHPPAIASPPVEAPPFEIRSTWGVLCIGWG